MKNRHKQRLFLYAFLTAAIMTAIFILSSQSAHESSMLSEGFLNTFLGRFLARILPRLTKKGIFNDIRKYAHMFEYFCLGICTALFFFELMAENTLRPALCSVALSLLYSCSDEWHQTFVPGRAGKLTDVGIDSIGILCAAALVLVLMRAKNKKIK